MIKILEKVEEKNTLRVLVDSNEESTFLLLKTYLGSNKDVDLVGVYREHHLVDKTEFFLKVKKGNPNEIFKKALAEIKKDLTAKKIK